jgi:hypothetical protein
MHPPRQGWRRLWVNVCIAVLKGPGDFFQQFQLPLLFLGRIILLFLHTSFIIVERSSQVLLTTLQNLKGESNVLECFSYESVKELPLGVSNGGVNVSCLIGYFFGRSQGGHVYDN